MRILILNWRDPKNPKSGGAEIVTLEHAKAWVKKGHKVTWFTSKFAGSKGTEKIHGIPFFTPLYVKKPKIAFIHEVANEIWNYMYSFPINKIGKSIEPILLS